MSDAGEEGEGGLCWALIWIYFFPLALGLDIEGQDWLSTIWAELGDAGDGDVFRSPWH